MKTPLRTVDYTIPLDKELRSYMEQGFLEDFGGVRIHVTGDSMPVACTIGEDIFISRGWYQPDTRLGRRILAHELAHVVQKRGGRSLGFRQSRTPPSTRLIEAEAHAAANVVAAGGRFACAIADEPDRPRFWGTAGHYYTVYYVLLAAGLENRKAAEIAFYAQLPDLAWELDAVQAGIRMAAKSSPLAIGYNVAQTIYNAISGDDQWQNLEVQRGLHVLTGRDAAVETSYREGILRGVSLSSPLEFGLATHAYADSFAHRDIDDPSCMYSTFVGQASELPWGAHTWDTPDDIAARHSLYKQYGQGLYKIACTKTPSVTRRADQPGVEWALKLASCQVTALGQIGQLRQNAKNIGQPMSDYQPSETWERWNNVKSNFPMPSSCDDVFALAHKWSP